MNASGYCRTIIETEETFSSDNLRMIVLWSDNKQVPMILAENENFKNFNLKLCSYSGVVALRISYKFQRE